MKTVKKQRSTKKYKFKEIATPAVVWLLVMFLLFGISSRLVQPYMALLVEVVHGFDGAAFYTGVASFASSLGGFFAGLCLGWLCDRIEPRKLLLPLLIVGGVFTCVMAFSTTIMVLIVTKFLAAFAVGGIKPVLQLILTKITPTELRGTYYGWSNSVNTAGGIVCSLIGGSVVMFTGVRGVYVSSAIILVVMVPLLLPLFRCISRERTRLDAKQ